MYGKSEVIMRIEKKQDIESLIRQNKGALAKKFQYDVLVCVEDIPRRTGSLYLNVNHALSAFVIIRHLKKMGQF